MPRPTGPAHGAPPLPAEFCLLLACARTAADPKTDAYIRAGLEAGIDWTAFVAKALEHNLVALVHRTLVRVAPDLIPDDIAGAFAVHGDRERQRNRALLAELARVLGELDRRGIPAIPFKGPVVALQAYGDIDLRTFRDLDVLIRESDADTAIDTLRGLGYAADADGLRPAQRAALLRIQGQELLVHRESRVAIEPHWRLTPNKMAVAIDYEGFWSRARRADIGGHAMLVLAPEDQLVTLLVHGGKELWWRLNWLGDVAAFAQARPDLDWDVVVARAAAQGCRRMALLGLSLAAEFLAAPVPVRIVDQAQGDRACMALTSVLVARWRAPERARLESINAVSRARMSMHDDGYRIGYLLRVFLLPAPRHIRMIALPRGLRWGYVVVKVVHDGVLLPMHRLLKGRRPRAKAPAGG